MEQKQENNQEQFLSDDYKRVHSISILSELEILLFQCQNSLSKPLKDVSRSDNEGSGKGSYKDKKASRWVGVKKLLCALRHKNVAANQVSYESGNESVKSQNQSEEEKDIWALRIVIGRIKTILKDKKQYGAYTRVSKGLDEKADELKGILKDILKEKNILKEMALPSETMSKIKRISKDISGLKSDMLGKKRDLYLPGLHGNSKEFLDILAAEVIEKISGLDFIDMLCLLSFTVFPENCEVKKTMLMYWWIGEGFLPAKGADGAKDAEVKAEKILDGFSRRGLIEPVKDDRKLKPNSYKMDPHVHSAVIYLAEKLNFFQIYENKKKKPSMAVSKKCKVCLVEGSSLQKEAKLSKMKKNLGTVKTVFNSSERFPDFTFKWFQHMNALKVLYIGRWERTPKRHIEVETTEFLENIKTMKELRLVSFQGISRIEKLDKSICQLSKLVILDLRSCYNLEVLPDDIDSLENLIYLDVSECYMLDRMPKEISELSKLQVLKGFVVSDADEENCCTLSQLERMTSLRKLSININKYDLKVEDLMKSLTKFTQLKCLKIAWGARFGKDEKGTMWFSKAWRKKEKAIRLKLQHKSTNEKEGDQGDNKGKTSMDKRGDAKEKGTLPLESKDRVQYRKEDDIGTSKTKMKGGDGKVEKVDVEEPKEHGGLEVETQKSGTAVEQDKKASPSQELERATSKKQDGHKGDDKEQKKQDGEEANIVEEDKKPSPSQELERVISKEHDGHKGDKEQKKQDGKQDGEEAKTQKLDKVVEEGKNASPSQELKPVIPEKSGDHKGDNEEQKQQDGRKEVDGERRKEQGGEEEKIQKSDQVIQENKNMIPSQEPKSVIQKKQDAHKAENNEQTKVGRKKEVGQDESKERGGEEAEIHKLDKVQEGESFAGMKKPLIQKKPDGPKGDNKGQNKEDGKTGEVDVGEGRKHDGIDTRSNYTQEIVEEDKEKNASRESNATTHKEPHDNKGDNAVMKNTAAKSSDPGIDKKSKIKECNDASIISKKEKRTAKKPESNGTYKLPPTLKTLELEGFPEEELPTSWLKPDDPGILEKLAIRGGKVSRIGGKTSNEDIKYDIKVLRLKYLDEFKAEWKDLHKLFPNMILLEKYKCPKVTFCPTDANGVWRRPLPRASTQKPK